MTALSFSPAPLKPRLRGAPPLPGSRAGIRNPRGGSRADTTWGHHPPPLRLNYMELLQ